MSMGHSLTLTFDIRSSIFDVAVYSSDMPSLLTVDSLTKRFPGVTALDRVSLTLQRGEVLAVIGENGAGKSTLMKTLAGVETPDAGTIRLDDQPVFIDSVRTALSFGIVLIHQ